MKKLVLLGILALVASFAFGEPQKKSFTATTRGRRVRPTPTPPPVRKTETDGVLPRAFQRGGNPLQMLNPMAPAKYGTSEDNVVLDPETGKWKGIKLFTIYF
jgi:hypothetical protein